MKLQQHYGLFINGTFVPSANGAEFEARNPATGELITMCAEATKEDVDTAVKAAQEAFPLWRLKTAAERAALLNKIADVIDENAALLASLESQDTGKPIRESTAIDIPATADQFRYFAGLIRGEEGMVTKVDANTTAFMMPEPLGVVGQIVPWNFPLMIGAWKLAPALAAGNCVVFKPSSSTSVTALVMADLLKDILPPGVLNVITGSGDKAGQFILDHPGIRKLSFTGSTETGRKVSEAAGKRLIPVTLELGGKSPNIFFDDCNREKAIEGVQLGILFNQGEVCAAGSRIFVQEGIFDEFVAELVNAFSRVKPGNPADFNTKLGAIVSKQQMEKVLNFIEIGKAEGAKVLCGGRRFTEGDCAKGFFIEPTLMLGTNDMRIAQEEIFGPVGVVIKFKDEAEVIRLANDSRFGLAGAVWTKDINRALRVAGAIESGRVWINSCSNVPSGIAFGGMKNSGHGREIHKCALDQYRQIKAIEISTLESPLGFYPQN
ncbi:MAG TPA: aldehyde dehydrogenase family protein [Methanocorpusculum sp.]|nr:aldehyde dehydrogenase family protein [Methanocorpusculum sp.]